MRQEGNQDPNKQISQEMATSILERYEKTLKMLQRTMSLRRDLSRSDVQFIPNILAALQAISTNTLFEQQAGGGMGGLPENLKGDPSSIIARMVNNDRFLEMSKRCCADKPELTAPMKAFYQEVNPLLAEEHGRAPTMQEIRLAKQLQEETKREIQDKGLEDAVLGHQNRVIDFLLQTPIYKSLIQLLQPLWKAGYSRFKTLSNFVRQHERAMPRYEAEPKHAAARADRRVMPANSPVTIYASSTDKDPRPKVAIKFTSQEERDEFINIMTTNGAAPGMFEAHPGDNTVFIKPSNVRTGVRTGTYVSVPDNPWEMGKLSINFGNNAVRDKFQSLLGLTGAEAEAPERGKRGDGAIFFNKARLPANQDRRFNIQTNLVRERGASRSRRGSNGGGHEL